ncbi:CD3072 family TudS-related putative desulfidase [Clostridium tagluense]|uniref:CD3072 family TudS-related putative desulfidase n=1 Tax=Clostridium tagluense TaxID=360422 RepID=UPI003558085D
MLNQNSVVLPLARSKGGFPIAKFLIDQGIGIIQLPCPEFKFLGPQRKPMNKEQYDSPEYRTLCKNLFMPILEDIKKYLAEDYSLVGILGINESPTCSISGKMGIFMEEIFTMLNEQAIDIKYFEIPTDYTEATDFNDLYNSLSLC